MGKFLKEREGKTRRECHRNKEKHLIKGVGQYCQKSQVK